MNAKETLCQLSKMEHLIESKKERLAVLHELATSCGVSAMTGMPSSSSPNPSRMENVLCKAVDLESEIQQDEAALQQKKLFLLDLIGQMDSPEHQTILINRYFKGRTWEKIADGMPYTKRWILKLHGQALASLEKQLSNVKKFF